MPSPVRVEFRGATLTLVVPEGTHVDAVLTPHVLQALLGCLVPLSSDSRAGNRLDFLRDLLQKVGDADSLLLAILTAYLRAAEIAHNHELKTAALG